MRVQYKPFMRWVWLGVLLMAVGALSASLARRLRRAAAAQTAPAAPVAAPDVALPLESPA
jgi:cytochrome c-type biogenesis protein CcmF